MSIRVVFSTLLLFGLALSVADPGVAQDRAKNDKEISDLRAKLTSKNPDTRAEVVEKLAAFNNKAAVDAVLVALSTENDGPAGFRMADAVAMLNSPDALQALEKGIMGWTSPERLFGAFWCFCGLARMNYGKADDILSKVVTDSKAREVYIRAAVIEALAYGDRADLAGLLLETVSKYEPEWDQKNVILTLTCIYNAPKLVKKAEPDVRNKIVMALADVLEKTKDDRTLYFLAKALAEITGEDTYIDPAFWRWWVEQGGRKVERNTEGKTVAGRDVPKFFKAAAVGKRVMFVIDISGSMRLPVRLPPQKKPPPPPPPPPKEKGPVTGKGEGGKPGEDKGAEEKKDEEKAPIPPPDYSRVKTKIDLAKVELIHCLRYLPEDYMFNVVIYATSHSLLDQGIKTLIPATKENRDRMIKKVEGLTFADLTNIHGALIRSFCINEKGMIDQKKQNPAWEPECMNSGATTIFFLTDGSPTTSDDTSNVGEVGSNGQVARPNGRMVRSQNILQDIRRVNTFRKAVINTIGIGKHDNRLLEALAKMTGGEYVDRSGMAD